MPTMNAEASKELFRRSIFDMYYEQMCIQKKRKVYLRWIHYLDGAVITLPTLIIFLIGMLPQGSIHLRPLLSIAGAVNIISAIINFYPFRVKSAELLTRSIKIEILINEMRFCWRKYDLGIIDLATFDKKHEAFYLEYGESITSISEEYKWAKDKDDKIKKSVDYYMQEFQ